jgi:hypothetical protein
MLKLIAITTLLLLLGVPASRADALGEQNHTPSVSDCDHRANVQDLKGQERKDFVDWCASRDQTAAGDSRQPDRFSECYARMTDRKLSGVDRGQYLRNCAAHTAYHMHGS